jgi:hypothetical protein
MCTVLLCCDMKQLRAAGVQALAACMQQPCCTPASAGHALTSCVDLAVVVALVGTCSCMAHQRAGDSTLHQVLGCAATNALLAAVVWCHHWCTLPAADNTLNLQRARNTTRHALRGGTNAIAFIGRSRSV